MGTGESKEVPSQSGNMSTFECDGHVLNGNFNTIVGNYNRINGNNNKIYGHNNLVMGNFNSSYGSRNVVKGNFCAKKRSKKGKTPDEKSAEKPAPWNAPKNVPLHPSYGRERKPSSHTMKMEPAPTLYAATSEERPFSNESTIPVVTVTNAEVIAEEENPNAFVVPSAPVLIEHPEPGLKSA